MIEFDNYKEPFYRVNGVREVIVGKTDPMLILFNYLNRLSELPSTVLITGETGTGKERCAKALHYNGTTRKKNNFVAVNCAGIPPDLLESILFGHVKGAFTGAYKDKQGKFQYANGGTLFLDEIGDMSLELQAKILRVLQEKQVMRIGSNTYEEIDVRIVAATNKTLEDEVNKGLFREDLFYRLNVIPVRVPSLRERKEDIPLIAEYFIKELNRCYKSSIDGLTDDAKEKLLLNEWKGNVRELRNIIERVFVMKSEGVIKPDDLCFGSNPMNLNNIRYEPVRCNYVTL